MHRGKDGYHAILDSVLKSKGFKTLNAGKKGYWNDTIDTASPKQLKALKDAVMEAAEMFEKKFGVKGYVKETAEKITKQGWLK